MFMVVYKLCIKNKTSFVLEFVLRFKKNKPKVNSVAHLCVQTVWAMTESEIKADCGSTDDPC